MLRTTLKTAPMMWTSWRLPALYRSVCMPCLYGCACVPRVSPRLVPSCVRVGVGVGVGVGSCALCIRAALGPIASLWHRLMTMTAVCPCLYVCVCVLCFASFQWLKANGARYPKIQWPAYATVGGVRGTVALEDIAVRGVGNGAVLCMCMCLCMCMQPTPSPGFTVAM